MTTPPASRQRALQLVAGLALGIACALVVKALTWLLPLMMFVGD